MRPIVTPPAVAQQPTPAQSGSRIVNPAPPLSTAEKPGARLHALMRQIEASGSLGDKQREHSIPGIGVSLSFGVDETRQPRDERGASKLTWYAPGETIIHAGLVIDGGMAYISERPLQWPGEPSAIISSLSVGQVAAHPLEDFGYYPSYDRITAEQRRCYLEWMSAGRQDADPAQRSLGYVFMFFYGLERRILLDRDRNPSLLEEILRYSSYTVQHTSRVR